MKLFLVVMFFVLCALFAPEWGYLCGFWDLPAKNIPVWMQDIHNESTK